MPQIKTHYDDPRYVNLSCICEEYDRNIDDWLNLTSTKEFLKSCYKSNGSALMPRLLGGDYYGVRAVALHLSLWIGDGCFIEVEKNIDSEILKRLPKKEITVDEIIDKIREMEEEIVNLANQE
jgi:hypothetical protein